MARREWGVRDRRTGGVTRAIDFAAAQHAVNLDAVRCELMVRHRYRGVVTEWAAVEWFVMDYSLPEFAPPPPPAAGRRLGVDEALGVRGSRSWARALYGAVRGLILGKPGLFRKHNG